MAAFVDILFNRPRLGALRYRNDPEGLARFGCRAAAPLGKRELVGYVVAERDEPPPGLDENQIKPIARSVDREPVFGEKTLALARWMAGMYFCSEGEALGAMLPSGRREPRSMPELPEAQAIIEARFGIGDPEPEIGERPLTLSSEQRAALERLLSKKSGTWYLYGLTGTGKTEVFLQAAEATLAEGRGVIYLVPEIALTGQVVEAAKRRFGDRCAVLHSGLTPSRRLAEWRRLLRGEAMVAIGARSAVFAPIERLGLVVIDEEHEASYKAGSSPRYHARQIAMKRCALEGARLVMGSATPSVEAWRLMQEGRLERLRLTSRPAGGAVPAVEIVDMTLEDGPISARLAEQILKTKALGGQSILFLNRRGFSYFFHCKTCGQELRCKHCSVALTYHKDRDALVCHYCGYRSPPPKVCPSCGSLDLGWAGFGTERVEQEALRLFPGLVIRRLDADSVARKGELESALEDFREGRADILLGTQMVAKGLNFPRVKTVGVILADTSLNLPDFRAAERAFSLIVQVAGRAGRFSGEGRVIVQTYRPHSPVIRRAAAFDADNFYREELEVRSQLGFPPYSRLVRLVLRSKEPGRARQAALEIAVVASKRMPSGVELLGPAECPLGMVAGSARWQLIFRAEDPGPLRRVLSELLAAYTMPGSLHCEIDMDPVSLM